MAQSRRPSGRTASGREKEERAGTARLSEVRGQGEEAAQGGNRPPTPEQLAARFAELAKLPPASCPLPKAFERLAHVLEGWWEGDLQSRPETQRYPLTDAALKIAAAIPAALEDWHRQQNLVGGENLFAIQAQRELEQLREVLSAIDHIERRLGGFKEALFEYENHIHESANSPPGKKMRLRRAAKTSHLYWHLLVNLMAYAIGEAWPTISARPPSPRRDGVVAKFIVELLRKRPKPVKVTGAAVEDALKRDKHWCQGYNRRRSIISVVPEPRD